MDYEIRKLEMITIPSKYAWEEMSKYNETFVLDSTDTANGKSPVLFLKLLPELIVSILNEVPIEIVIRNPKVEPYSITVYIKDIEDSPYFFTKKVENQKIDQIQGVSNVALDLVNSKTIIVSLFDEQMQNKYGFEAVLNKEGLNFDQWITLTKTLPRQNDYFPERQEYGFLIRLNYKIKSDISYTNAGHKKAWGQDKFYTTGTNKSEGSFYGSNYKGIGKQGYLQEQSIKEYLGGLFTINFELYYSLPRPNNPKEELTDFLIFKQNTILLIESKCVRPFLSDSDSMKNINSSENSISSLIAKATKQLKRAEDDISTHSTSLEPPSLIKQFIFTEEIVKICIVSDLFVINESKLAKKLAQYERKDLPIILSLADFYSIFDMKGPDGSMSVFRYMKNKFLSDDSIVLPIFRLE